MIALSEAPLSAAQAPAVQAAPATGKLVAVIGGGPSGMACAYHLGLLGNSVVLYEARSRERMQGAPVLDRFAQAGFERMVDSGRICCEYGRKLGVNLDLAELHLTHDALYLGIGLTAARVLGLGGPDPAGLLAAAGKVATVYASQDVALLAAPERAIVIGTGPGAARMATRLTALGAQDVTLALRHGAPNGSDEIAAARARFVRVRQWLAPLEVLRAADGAVVAVRFAQTRMQDGCLAATGGFTEIAAQAVFKAVGRADLALDARLRRLSCEGEQIQVDGCFRTLLPSVYAGGDCVVSRLAPQDALLHGERAAWVIHADLAA